jgi:hypothetical protein
VWRERKSAGIASAAIVFVIIAGGFLVSVPVTTLVPVRIPVSQTQTVTYVTSSTTLIPITNQGTGTSAVFGIAQTTLRPNQYTNAGAYLTPGSNVWISYSADDTVDVYVFNSTQFSQYAASRTTSPNMALQTGASSGTIGFYVNLADTYYLILHNPHTGLGAFEISVSASGTDTYPTTFTTYIKQVVTYTTSGIVVTTRTLTGISTQSCSHPFWNWLLGAKNCP